jgi:hypothetical protein
MNKKIIIASILTLSAAVAIPVFAQTTTTTPNVVHGTTSVKAQLPILQVGSGGKVMLRGTIASISGNSLTVTSWGGPWTVNVDSGAEILPTAANKDITKFKTGDFIGVQGTVSQSANFTINATIVRDRTYRAGR